MTVKSMLSPPPAPAWNAAHDAPKQRTAWSFHQCVAERRGRAQDWLVKCVHPSADPAAIARENRDVMALNRDNLKGLELQRRKRKRGIDRRREQRMPDQRADNVAAAAKRRLTGIDRTG